MRCSRNQTGKNAGKLFVDNGGRAFRTATPEAKGADGDPWPVYWWLRAGPNWWTDLNAYRDLIVANVLNVADAVRPALDVASAVEVVGSPDESE